MKSLDGYSPVPVFPARKNRASAGFWFPPIPSPRLLCTLAKIYKPGFARTLRKWWIWSKEGEIILIRSLTSISVLQNLAAHSIFGCLRAAEILPINPEARVIFLYQITVVPDYCKRRKERERGDIWLVGEATIGMFSSEYSGELQTTAPSSATLKGSKHRTSWLTWRVSVSFSSVVLLRWLSPNQWPKR